MQKYCLWVKKEKCNIKEQVEQIVTTHLNSQDDMQVLWHSF